MTAVVGVGYRLILAKYPYKIATSRIARRIRIVPYYGTC
jgi:hypothetical protein